MFGARVNLFVPVTNQVRSYVTLKEINMRLKSVKNIQKITKSMKMVSAAKFAQAERVLKATRPGYGAALANASEKFEVEPVEENMKKHLLVVCSSDRGLCGGIHSSVSKAVKLAIADEKEGRDTKIVCIGDKARSILQRVFADKMLFSVNDIGKRNITFLDCSLIANSILSSGFEFDSGDIIYNRFKSVISYDTTLNPFYSNDVLTTTSKSFGLYDSLDAETLQCYQEFQLASMIYYGLKENATSEQSARMSAMDGATKNAGEMINKLTLYYNRTRQAVITRELIEIISGAAALDVKE
jgi:F-type H+-transporting ATPase subunit gamma